MSTKKALEVTKMWPNTEKRPHDKSIQTCHTLPASAHVGTRGHASAHVGTRGHASAHLPASLSRTSTEGNVGRGGVSSPGSLSRLVSRARHRRAPLSPNTPQGTVAGATFHN